MNENKNIEFTVKGREFVLPTKGVFNWNVDWLGLGGKAELNITSKDDVPVSFHFNNDGYHTIVLKPGDGLYTPGWGKAFTFGEDTFDGWNTPENKAKLVYVVSDPDIAHMDDEQTIGDNFRRLQFFNCVNLENLVADTFPDTVTSIGNDYCKNQYLGCHKIFEKYENKKTAWYKKLFKKN